MAVRDCVSFSVVSIFFCAFVVLALLTNGHDQVVGDFVYILKKVLY